MKCFVCKGEVPEMFGFQLNADGDFACSKKCDQRYIRERDHFFNVVLPDEERCKNWLMGED